MNRSALQNAAPVMPLTTRFFWGDIDLNWFPEACWSHPRRKNGGGFYTVEQFMEGSAMPGAEVLCIRDWRKRLLDRQPMTETTPLHRAAIGSFREAAKSDPELQKNVTGCEALAWLGRYYASKIRGGSALSLLDATGAPIEKGRATREGGRSEAPGGCRRDSAVPTG